MVKAICAQVINLKYTGKYKKKVKIICIPPFTGNYYNILFVGVHLAL